MTNLSHWLQDFIAVTDEEMVAINDMIEVAHLNANEIILKQGQVATRVGLLVQGATCTYYTDQNGNQKTTGFFFEGQPLIVMDSFLNQTPSSVSSATLEPSIIVWTNYERFTSFLNNYPRYNTVFISAMAKWFTESKNRMEYLHQPSAKAKYDKMCELHPNIIQRVPLKYIASYLGITQETLSRVRGKK